MSNVNVIAKLNLTKEELFEDIQKECEKAEAFIIPVFLFQDGKMDIKTYSKGVSGELTKQFGILALNTMTTLGMLQQQNAQAESSMAPGNAEDRAERHQETEELVVEDERN